MYDLMALAFEGDITRSITFMLGRDLSGASFPESGFTGGWHGTSHHGDKPENVANYAKVNRYHVQNLAYFCEKLSKIPDGDGTVLDHVLIYKGSNMGNSHRHAHEKVPVILVGGIDGTFKGNRHLVFPDNTQRTSNMLLSILHLYGIEMDKIGTSTGPAAAARDGVSAIDDHGSEPLRIVGLRCRGRGASALAVDVWRSPRGGAAGGRADAAAGGPAAGAGAAGDLQELHVLPRHRRLRLQRARPRGVGRAASRRSTRTGRAACRRRTRAVLLDWLVVRFGPTTKPFPRAYVAQEVTTFFSDAEAEALLKRACTSCHGIDRVNDARFSSRRWRVVTVDMRERGAKLDDEELERLVEWLGRTKGTNDNDRQ